MPKMDFEQALYDYKNQHQTAGCIVTHMFGVPMIAFSFFFLPINVRKSLTYFVLGWILQLIGHYYFEKNKPVLFTKNGKNLWTPVVALFMVGKYWSAAFTGNLSIYRQNGRTLLIPYRNNHL